MDKLTTLQSTRIAISLSEAYMSGAFQLPAIQDAKRPKISFKDYLDENKIYDIPIDFIYKNLPWIQEYGSGRNPFLEEYLFQDHKLKSEEVKPYPELKSKDAKLDFIKSLKSNCDSELEIYCLFSLTSQRFHRFFKNLGLPFIDWCKVSSPFYYLLYYAERKYLYMLNKTASEEMLEAKKRIDDMITRHWSSQDPELIQVKANRDKIWSAIESNDPKAIVAACKNKLYTDGDRFVPLVEVIQLMINEIQDNLKDE